MEALVVVDASSGGGRRLFHCKDRGSERNNWSLGDDCGGSRIEFVVGVSFRVVLVVVDFVVGVVVVVLERRMEDEGVVMILVADATPWWYEWLISF